MPPSFLIVALVSLVINWSRLFYLASKTTSLMATLSKMVNSPNLTERKSPEIRNSAMTCWQGTLIVLAEGGPPYWISLRPCDLTLSLNFFCENGSGSLVLVSFIITVCTVLVLHSSPSGLAEAKGALVTKFRMHSISTFSRDLLIFLGFPDWPEPDSFLFVSVQWFV
jgi:hypothetical protein